MPDTNKVFEGRLHVAVIMDGNGRWARSRSLPRVAGHREGAKAVRRTVETAAERDIGTLTLYAFSADNWARPEQEVSALMNLLERYLDRERQRCIDNGVRLSVIGRRDRLRPAIVEKIEEVEHATAAGTRLHLRIAIDYSARQAIARAAGLVNGHGTPSPEAFAALLNRAIHSEPAAPDVDLLIRTSGELRLSDFLLWECAYAELYFTETFWPDFDAAELDRALTAFRRRDRRFGRVYEIAELAS